VRRALTWLAGAVGLAALARHFSRRRAPAVEGTATADPAEELRRRLATQREEEPEPAPADPAREEPEETDAPVDLAERRAEVHARAQEAIESMREGELPVEGPEDEPVA